MSFDNPLSHVKVQEAGVLMLGGREVPFEGLDSRDLGWLQDRRPVMKPMLGGQASGKTINDLEVRMGFTTVIAIAVANAASIKAAGRRATEQEIIAVEKAANGLSPLEKETQGLRVLFATFPGSEEAFLKDLGSKAEPKVRKPKAVAGVRTVAASKPRRSSTTTR